MAQIHTLGEGGLGRIVGETTSKATVILHFILEKCWAFKWERTALVLQGKSTEMCVVFLCGSSVAISSREIRESLATALKPSGASEPPGGSRDM